MAPKAADQKLWASVQFVRIAQLDAVPVGEAVDFVYDGSVYIAESRGDQPTLPSSQQVLKQSVEFGIPAFGAGIVGEQGCAGRLWASAVEVGGRIRVVVSMCQAQPDVGCVGTRSLSYVSPSQADAGFCENCCKGMEFWCARYGIQYHCPAHGSDSAKVQDRDRATTAKPRDVRLVKAGATEWKVPGVRPPPPPRSRRQSGASASASAASPAPAPAVAAVQPAGAAGAGQQPVAAPQPPPPSMQPSAASEAAVAAMVQQLMRYMQSSPVPPATAAAPPPQPAVSLGDVKDHKADARPSAAAQRPVFGPSRPSGLAHSTRVTAAADGDGVDDGDDDDDLALGPARAAQRQSPEQRFADALASAEPVAFAGAAHMYPSVPDNAWHIASSGLHSVASAGGVIPWLRAQSNDTPHRDMHEVEALMVTAMYLRAADGADAPAARMALRRKALATVLARVAYLLNPDSLGGPAHVHRSVPSVRQTSWLPPEEQARNDKAIASYAAARNAVHRASGGASYGRGGRGGRGRGHRGGGRGGGADGARGGRGHSQPKSGAASDQ